MPSHYYQKPLTPFEIQELRKKQIAENFGKVNLTANQRASLDRMLGGGTAKPSLSATLSPQQAMQGASALGGGTAGIPPTVKNTMLQNLLMGQPPATKPTAPPSVQPQPQVQPQVQQPRQLSLSGGNPMAAILMGLGGGLSSRAAGGTLGQGFTRGARLGMSMSQAKQLRGRQKEILRRQDEADRREERRLKLLEEKRTEEKTAFKNIQAFRKSALAGGDLSPSARVGILGGTDPYKTVAQDKKAQAKETSASAKGYSKALRDNLGLELPKAEKAGKMMAENPQSFGSIYKIVQAGGDVDDKLLRALNQGATFNRIDPDGTVRLNKPPKTFAPDVTGRRLAPDPGVF